MTPDIAARWVDAERRRCAAQWLPLRARPVSAEDGDDGDGEDDGATVIKFWEVEEGIFSLGARHKLVPPEDQGFRGVCPPLVTIALSADACGAPEWDVSLFPATSPECFGPSNDRHRGAANSDGAPAAAAAGRASGPCDALQQRPAPRGAPAGGRRRGPAGRRAAAAGKLVRHRCGDVGAGR